ncbi:hypothetical protein [Oceanobacillus kimchii]|uniref:hypothetical protein n=1 Tax=Oceanobacillus kimchii TaxID=746691 RepID=UPI00034C445A|nr:hypothetical protein [Oceanobacillus kimchii]
MSDTKDYKIFKLVFHIIILIVAVGVITAYAIDGQLGYIIFGILIAVGSAFSIFKELRKN